MKERAGFCFVLKLFHCVGFDSLFGAKKKLRRQRAGRSKRHIDVVKESLYTLHSAYSVHLLGYSVQMVWENTVRRVKCIVIRDSTGF